MQQIIIGLIGQQSAGKGAAAEYLISEHSATMVKYSDYLRFTLNKWHIEINRKNLAGLSLALRTQFGERIFSHAISEDLKSNTNPIVIIDGIRRLDDMNDFQDNPNFHLVSVEADPKIRYERLTQRTENNDDQGKSYEEFLADHELETEREIANIIAKAEFRLDNSGSLETLYAQIDTIIKNLK